MKNLLRGSLLTLIFVGMSGFNTNNIIDAKSSLLTDENPGWEDRDCNEEATYAAEIVQRFRPHLSKTTIMYVWQDIFSSCLDETGGLKFGK